METKIKEIEKYLPRDWKEQCRKSKALVRGREIKTAEESKFNDWANKSENKAKYGKVVATINKYYANTNLKSRHDNYLTQLMRTASYGGSPANLGNSLLAYYKENEAKRKRSWIISKSGT